MPTELRSPPPAPTIGLDAAHLEALRRLALQCAVETDAARVLAVLRAGISPLDGADVLEVTGAEVEEDAPLAALRAQAAGDGAVVVGAAPGLRRAVAVPIRVRGEPAVLALGWSAEDPGAERARALAVALAEQAAVALSVAERHAALRDAAARRDRFFSAMSHDLRTPITAIVGYAELLQDGIVGPLGERQQEMVERICQVSGELSQLVTDLLDLAKLDAGRMEFHREPATIQEMVEEGLEVAEPQLTAAGAAVRRGPAGDLPRLRVDRPRVRQLLANLLAHAARAAPDGAVRLDVGSGPGEVWVEVADAGPPLAPGSEEALFEPLARSGARAGRVGPGAALSLALSRRLARAMGGDLEARAAPEGGVALRLRLPSDGG